MRLDSGQIEVLDDMMAETLRQKTPQERLKVGFNIWLSAHNMLTTFLRKAHPEWNNKKLQQEILRRTIRGAIRTA